MESCPGTQQETCPPQQPDSPGWFVAVLCRTVAPLHVCNDPRMEQWRQIKGFPMYEVSTRGRVRSWHTRRGRILRGKLCDGSYTQVCLRFEQVLKYKMVHLLVLEAFVGPCPPGHQGSHVDSDPANNTLPNLLWETPQQNLARALVMDGRSPSAPHTGSAKAVSRQWRQVAEGMLAQGYRQCEIVARTPLDKFQIHRIAKRLKGS